jgi:DNA-binding NarL/FixJ family response regulator
VPFIEQNFSLRDLSAGWISNDDMSKRRPSRAKTMAGPPGAGSKTDLAYWQLRLFKNTFTRQGRRFELKGWRVKIQHLGRRQTFALVSPDRAQAAAEARLIYETILTHGWQAIPRHVGKGKSHPHGTPVPVVRSDFPKSNGRYWQQRLIQRPHGLPAGEAMEGEFSVRLEHQGTSFYFPLGQREAGPAAGRAQAIYQTVQTEGWAAACEKFSRELTLAIHWSDNPLAWTYTTIRTRVAPTALPARPGRRIALVGAEGPVQWALAFHLSRQPDWVCVAQVATADALFGQLSPDAVDLALVNQHLPDLPGVICLQRLQEHLPNTVGLLFSLYESSDQLFFSTPGGAAGYLLKRTLPDRILEPLDGLGSETPLTGKVIAGLVRQYFQRVVTALPGSDSAGALGSLTRRETEILDLLSKGYLDKEIAHALRISPWTVHGHLKAIFEKLSVHTRTEAVVKYLQK